MSALRNGHRAWVAVSMLLEVQRQAWRWRLHGRYRQNESGLPAARIYFLGRQRRSLAGGKVHAKVAVCDEAICFVSSANLTGHAMEKNMEAGVLIRGGSLPMKLQNHLEALVTVKILNS